MTRGATVTAVTRDRFGPPDVLRLADVARPAAVARDSVLVRVHAASVNPGDSHATRGVPYLARLGYGLLRPRNRVAGTDVAGRVEAVGEGVTGLRSGDEVFGWCRGAFAEYAVATEGTLSVKPANLTFEQAAAVPTAACTALQGLRDRGRLRAGQHVLVVGASGGVGTFAVQIAKSFGAEVTGVCGTRNVELVRSTGADHVVDYSREDFTEGEPRYDLILDLVGNTPLTACRRVLKPDGTLVVVGGGKPRSLTGMGRFTKAALISPFVGQSLRPLFSRQSRDDLTALKGLLEAGKVLPVIDRQYVLAEARVALRHVESGHARGKVVIAV